MPRIQIEEVLSYYTQFRRKPIGRWHVETCRNVSCSMCGAERLMAHLKEKLGIEPRRDHAGRPHHRGRPAECLGSCGTAPVVVVNNTYHESMDVEKLDALLGGLD